MGLEVVPYLAAGLCEVCNFQGARQVLGLGPPVVQIAVASGFAGAVLGFVLGWVLASHRSRPRPRGSVAKPRPRSGLPRPRHLPDRL